ncbi:MAG: translation elongation factor Ts [Verrucomicrobiae bacterium]|nr:translation elongation factor Ts [Verrucomicrobiae bacterium]
MSEATVEISAKQVAELRAATNASMMECKKALIAVAGDMEKAVTELRKRGAASADKKSGRDAREGVIASSLKADGSSGVLAEVNCETDFVARNNDFVAFVKDVADTALADSSADFKGKAQTAVQKLGENIVVRRTLRYDLQGQGLIASYIHLGGKVGVLLEVGSQSGKVVNEEAFRNFVKDVTLHIAASSPLCVSRDQVNASLIEREREIYAEQVKDKPAQAIAKIIEGKLNKFLSGVALLEQAFVKNPDTTIKDHMAATGKTLGEEISIRRFARFQVGEDIAA